MTRDWKQALVEATVAAARDLRARLGPERLYAFALYTSGEDDFSYVIASANTEEGLDRRIRTTVEPGLRPRPEAAIRRDLRWSACDWAYHDFAPAVAAVTLPPTGTRRRDGEVRRAFLAALKAVDEAGIFGRAAEREAVMLALLCGDMSDEFLLRGLREINPPSLVNRYLERETPEPFLARLRALPDAIRAFTLVDLWEALALDGPGTWADEARAAGATAYDVEHLIREDGSVSASLLIGLVERNGFGEGWFAKGTPEFERWGAARPAMCLASAATFALEAVPLGAEDVARLQRLIARRVELDRSLELAPTLAENVARVLHRTRPDRFPASILGRRNHLENPEAFLPGDEG